MTLMYYALRTVEERKTPSSEIWTYFFKFFYITRIDFVNFIVIFFIAKPCSWIKPKVITKRSAIISEWESAPNPEVLFKHQVIVRF